MLLVFLCVFTCLIVSTQAFRFNTIEVIVGNNPIYGYPVTVAAFDVAYARLLPLYPELLKNSTRNLFYTPGNQTCEQAGEDMNVLAGKIWELLGTTDGFNLILTPGGKQ